MDYLEDLEILRDLYYRLSEKSIFFDEKEVKVVFDEKGTMFIDDKDKKENRKLIEDYIKNYCERYGFLKKYHYLVDHVMLLRIALFQGRRVQTEVFNGTLGLDDDDRLIKETLEKWNTKDFDKDWARFWWENCWNKSTNKDKFIQEYGKEYIDKIIKEVEILNNRRKEL